MKNIFNIKLIYAAILGSILLSACEKDFLEITPTDRVSDAAILTDSTLFEAFVINRYLGVRLTNKEGDGSLPGFGRGFEYAMWSSLTDESIYNNDDNTWLIQQGQLSPENFGIAGTIWGRSYRSIREVNYALTNIEDLEMSESHKDLLKAELHFIRAYRYHDLIRNYGQVVLVGDMVSQLGEDFTDPSLFEKSSIQEGIDYAVSELDKAISVLPVEHSGSWQEGRATKGAAMGLKSRLLLYAASPLYTGGSSDTQKWATAKFSAGCQAPFAEEMFVPAG